MSVTLLKTKLHIPAPRAELVSRVSPGGKLDQILTHKLTLLSAPAGFGKTTLLAEWTNHQTRTRSTNDSTRVPQIAWFSLDESDNDSNRFWSYVTAALEPTHPDLAGRARELLQAREVPSAETVLTWLVNTAAEWREPVVLVLDDYHIIHARPVHSSIRFFLEHLPANLHLVMTTRSDPPLPLAHWRARGQLLELRESDFRFTLDEAAAFFNQHMQLDLTASDIAALAARTEGWIAGLQLAALALSGLRANQAPDSTRVRDDTRSFIESFTGTNRYIISYLVEQVWNRQSAPIQNFMLQTSILARMNADLCNAVTERADAAETLEFLDANNLFLISLDDVQEWYRYHRLFADVLQNRLHKTEPALIQQLHLRASAWLAQNGLAGEAIEHALAAQDFERAGHLIEQEAESVDNRGEYNTIKRWLVALPDSVVQAHARLSFLRGAMFVTAHRLEEGEKYLNAAERALAADPATPAKPHLQTGIDVERIFIALTSGNLARTIELAEGVLARLPAEELKYRGEATMRLATAYFWNDQLAPAAEKFNASLVLSQQAGDVNRALITLSFLAILAVAQGRLKAAYALFQQMIEMGDRYGSPDTSARLTYGDLGSLLYELNRIEEAVGYLNQAIEQTTRGDYPRLLTWSLVPMARLLQGVGDVTGAFNLIERCEQLVQDYQLAPEYATLVAEQHVRLWLARGNQAAASNWARGRGLTGQDEFNLQQEPEYYALARVLIAEQAYARALALLTRLEDKAVRAGRTKNLIQTLALQAIALQQQGDTAHALPILERALELAEPEGFVRTFVDEGASMHLLLSLCRAQLAGRTPNEMRRRLPGYVDKLLAVFPHIARQIPSTAKDVTPTGSLETLAERLSERELQVLRLLAAGKSNQDIAGHLFLSLNTVKRHVTHIFEKLAVNNRTQAVNRARELNLL